MSDEALVFDASPEELVIFLSEGEEQLELLSEGILRLEHEGDTNADLLQAIFRAAHTAKGSSGAIGHQRMAHLTHALETVLDQVRHHTLPITTEMIDLLLRGVDALRVLLDEVTTLVASEIDIASLCAALDALGEPEKSASQPPMPDLATARRASFCERGGSAPRGVATDGLVPRGVADAANDAPRGAAPDDAPLSSDTWRVTVALDAATPLPSARALQTVLACGQLGTVLASTPTLEMIEIGKVIAEYPVIVWVRATSEPEAIEARARQVIERVPEVQVREVVAVPSESVVGSAPALASAVLGPPVRLEAPSRPVANGVPLASNVAPKPSEPAGGDHARLAIAHAPRMVRIDVERLDALMNLIGELVIDRTRLARIATKMEQPTRDPVLIEELAETCRHLARISDDLQDEVMRSRMLPIETVFGKFPRLVRDLALQVGKRIDLVIEGKDTELDRSVAEQIGDPIIHLLRNAVDHGVETPEQRHAAGKPEIGQVRLAARHEENQIVIDVEDDGRGMDATVIKNKAVNKGIITPEVAARLSDREALDLIFASGFSTAEQISDISGRGVGMDIVRTNVERLNGTISVATEVGAGTCFTVRLPLTLAIIRALLIKVAGQTYAIPLVSVVEALRLDAFRLRSVNGREAIELRGQVLPLLRLRQIFADLSPGKVPAAAPEGDARQFVVAVRWGERFGGLIVDSLVGEQEIVIKPLGNIFRATQGIAGGAVLGNGRLAPILDVGGLIKHLLATERRISVPEGAKP